jgi:hypothetical protein
MGWMTIWRCVADVERLGKSTHTSESAKTSSANHVGCIELWSSSMAQRSASLGRAILTKQLSPFQSLMASQSYLALGLVVISTAPIPIMSLGTTRVKKQIERK